MKSLNKTELKNELMKQVAHDKYDLPIYVCKNLKLDLAEVFKKYIPENESNLKLNLKVLRGEKFLIQVECETSHFLIN